MMKLHTNSRIVSCLLALSIAAPFAAQAQAPAQGQSCVSLNNYTHKKKLKVLKTSSEVALTMGVITGAIIGGARNNNTGTPNQLNMPAVDMALGAFVAAPFAMYLYEGNKNHRHGTEILLVQAENGVGDRLNSFVKKVQKQKGYQNADAEAIRQILKYGNESMLYCSNGAGLVTEDVLMADVKNKIDTNWRPSDPVEVLTPDPIPAAAATSSSAPAQQP